MMNAIAARRAFDDATTQWRSSARLRYGVYAILCILWIYGLILVDEGARKKRTAWLSAERQIVQSRWIAQSADWVLRAAEAKSARSEYETLLWREGSIGLARAAVQESLTRKLTAAGLTLRQPPRVSGGEAAVSDELPEVTPIRVRFQVEFKPGAFNEWLAGLQKDMAEKKPSLLVESLTIRGAPALSADVEIVAFALKQDGEKTLPGAPR